MHILRRGYQGKRFRVFDLENECSYLLSTDEFQIILWFSENHARECSDEREDRTIDCDHQLP
jgi:hypothetical protein